MEYSAGNWRINASEGGYPVWIELHRKQFDCETNLAKLHHSELRDLKYVIDRLVDALPYHSMLKGKEHEVR